MADIPRSKNRIPFCTVSISIEGCYWCTGFY